jgi:hypothetical protein
MDVREKYGRVSVAFEGIVTANVSTIGLSGAAASTFTGVAMSQSATLSLSTIARATDRTAPCRGA